jgi:hypothetical protein
MSLKRTIALFDVSTGLFLTQVDFCTRFRVKLGGENGSEDFSNL